MHTSDLAYLVNTAPLVKVLLQPSDSSLRAGKVSDRAVLNVWILEVPSYV